MSAPPPLRMLIVDDNAEDRENYRRLLTRAPGSHCSFAETDSGEEGVELCVRLEPDCILLDYQLPDLNGLEFLNRLFQELHHPLTPVVMLTGQGNEAVAVEAMKRGAQDYLVKGALTSEALDRAVFNAVERVSMQRELTEQRQELQQFARVVAHDLQEPLRTIGGYCRLLERHYEGRLDQTAEEWLAFAVDGAVRMQTLIQDLLTYSEVGSADLPRTPVSCNDAFDEAIANLRTAIRERNATVTRSDLPEALGSASLLIQLFQNLINNALKFTTEVPRIHAAAELSGAVWTVSVCDNGIGIKPEYQTRIFDIFKRLHSRRQYPGTGIGLAVCKRVVQRHGGRIWVESAPGTGSTFRFTISALVENSHEKEGL